MDNKVIEVLDYMGEKLGIAIDWTSANVMPQVTEFMERYRAYAIVENGIHIIIFMILVAMAGILLRIMYKGIKTKDSDNIWYSIHWETGGVIPVVIGIIVVIGMGVTIVNAITHIFNIAKWALIPEMQFFETFCSLLEQGK